MINLEYGGKLREDIRGILKYTLQLDYCPPGYISDANLVESVVEATRNCCSILMTSHGVNIDFFGSNDTLKNNRIKSSNSETLESLLFYDCILHCYHVLLEYYTSDMEVSHYAIDKKIRNAGFNELLNKGTIVFKQENNPTINSYGSSSKGDPSNFIKTYSLHVNIFNSAWEADEFPTLDIPYIYSNTAYLLHAIGAPTLKHIYKLPSKNPVVTFNAITSIRNDIYKDLIPYKKTDVHYKADRLYKYYLSETCFNVDLEYALMSYLIHTSKNQHEITDKNSLKTICSCCKLQNVISRKHFLLYALNAIDYRTESHNDFWKAHYFELEEKASSPFISPKQPNGFYYDKWREQFELFIGYISKFLYPIYAWTFLSLFLDTIEEKDNSTDHLHQIKKGLDCLVQYLNKNYSKIVEAINPSNSVSISENDVQDYSEQIVNLHSAFINNFPKRKMIPYVDQTLFVSNDLRYRVNHEYPNIRNFYINWVKYNRILADCDDNYSFCEICGGRFNVGEAKNSFRIYHESSGFLYKYFSKELCFYCANKAIQSKKANLYTPSCSSCGDTFDYFKELSLHKDSYQSSLLKPHKMCYQCYKIEEAFKSHS